jgi:hypothetical protein
VYSGLGKFEYGFIFSLDARLSGKVVPFGDESLQLRNNKKIERVENTLNSFIELPYRTNVHNQKHFEEIKINS